MPRRHPILGGLLAGVAGPLQDYLASRQHDIDLEKANARIAKRQADESNRTEERTLRKDLLDRVSRGEMESEQAQRAMVLMGHPMSQGGFDSVQPSVETEVGKIAKGITETKTYGDLQSEAGINATLPKRVAPIPVPDVPIQFRDMSSDTNPFETGDPNANRIGGALQATRRRLAAATPVTELESVNPETGAPQKTARQFNPIERRFTDLGTTTTGPTAAQAGRLASGKTTAELAADLAGGVPEQKGVATGRQKDTEQPGVLQRLDEELGVRDTHARKQATFAHSLTAGSEELAQVTLHDAEGNEIPGVLNKHTGEVKAGTIPEGMKGGKPFKLTAAQQTQQTDLNTAETTGVKLLEQLKATGLDKDNDPASPRLQRFLVNTLKIAPKDAAKAGVQWDAAYINATLSRTLMGGRPSQYIAEMMQPHLPQQAMSGQQLANVMDRVLGTIEGKRKELAGVSRVPLAQLTPKSGKSYEQYRTEREGLPATGPATLELDANGNLVPVGRGGAGRGRGGQ